MNYKKFNAYKSLVSTSLLSLTLGLLNTACESSSTALQSSEAQATTQPVTQIVAAAEADNNSEKNNRQNAPVESEPIESKLIESEIDPANAYIKDDYSQSEIDPADACILNACDTGISPKLLSIEELNIISNEISPDHAIIREQSFSINLPVIGHVNFVAQESKADQLYLILRTDRNEYEALYESPQWNLQEVTAVAFEDIQQDGDGPDIIIMANYITGIGPTGAQPFSAATVLFNRGNDTFQNDFAVDQVLSDSNASTIGDVIEIAQAEGLVHGFQYREGR